MNGIVIVVEPVEIVDKKQTSIYMGGQRRITPESGANLANGAELVCGKNRGNLSTRFST